MTSLSTSTSTYSLYHRPQTPLLVVLSGPSGAGKDTVLNRLRELNPELHFVVTATTRAPRENEQHGRDYFFLSQNEFVQMIEQNELLEWALVYNDYKGIPKEQVRRAFTSGKDVLMRVDVQGAATVRSLAKDAVLIFLMTESEQDLIDRLMERKSESPDELRLRIATAHKEMASIDLFDYYVINRTGKLDEAVAQVMAIIHAEHQRVVPRRVVL